MIVCNDGIKTEQRIDKKNIDHIINIIRKLKIDESYKASISFYQLVVHERTRLVS